MPWVRRLGPLPLRCFSGLVVIWLVLPILVVIPLSLTGTRSFVFPPSSYSFRWFENLFSDPAWRDALWNSSRIAVFVVLLSVAIGTAAALSLDRGRLPAKNLITGLILAPMIVPVIIIGVGIYAVFLRWHLIGGDLGFVLAHSVTALPFVVVSVLTSLRGFDRELERAAGSLGAARHVTFVTVTLPLIRPGMLAGAAFAFIMSFDELVIAQFLSTPFKKTLPVKMYGSLTEIDPTIAAASMVLLAATTVVILAVVMTVASVREP